MSQDLPAPPQSDSEYEMPIKQVKEILECLEEPTKADRSTLTFPVVGIGASAGGLKPLSELLKHLPADTGMAFVIVQHLHPDHESMMPSILARAASMQVQAITDGMRVEPNHIYVMPENVSLNILDGVLKLLPQTAEQYPRLPIDAFFQALANDWRNNSIGVILSGSASDGSVGIMSIKEEGGVTFAQDAAEYDSMPRSAMATGCVDFVCSPKEIAEKLVEIGRHLRSGGLEKEAEKLMIASGPLAQILKLLWNVSRIDFTNYKTATIKRRIVRRMLLRKLQLTQEYVALLENDNGEVHALLDDVLINVTFFFRDPEIFEALKKDVFPSIIKGKADGSPLRIWVVGCSTGQEVYSIAIALFEILGERSNDFRIQIFASDAKETCIETARKGIYTKAQVANISADRLRRYFSKMGEDYQIIKSIRDICIFARQNILADPPYSKMDLISCRNLLIYLDPVLQKKVLPAFHYSLKPSGFLVLGKSESISTHTELFHPVDKNSKVYSKKISEKKTYFGFAPNPPGPGKTPAVNQKGAGQSDTDIFKEADRVILKKYEPASVVINDQMEILQFRGDTTPFINNNPGVPSTNLFKMLRDGMSAELHTAIKIVREEGRTIGRKSMRIKYLDELREVSLEVIPLKSPSDDRCFLILFTPGPPPAQAPDRKAADEEPPAENLLSRFKALEDELIASKIYMNSVIEEREFSNRELQSFSEATQSSNEEFQSMNEELQSTNEELETAKEELQATNEELTTVNDELQSRISQLTVLNSDMTNLLTSIHLPVVMVDRELRIRRYTHMAGKILRLLPSDISRPFTDIRPAMELPNFEAFILEVIATAAVKEMEIQDKGGNWYFIHIRPYKTLDNKIDGAIIIMTDINELKRSYKLLEIHQAKLLESNRDLQQFAYIASHDLQEPLRMISMHLDLLESGQKYKMDSEAHRCLEYAQKGAARSQQLISDLLGYARISALEKPHSLTNFEVVLKHALSNLQLVVVESGAEISHGPLPELLADSFQMDQLFQNLLSNAIKYRSENPLKVHISAEHKDKEWLFAFKDNGIGIAPQHKDEIFAIFQRIHAKTELPGTGIGLAICKKIVDRHAGRIWVDSAPGKGSTFYFTLPPPTHTAII